MTKEESKPDTVENWIDSIPLGSNINDTKQRDLIRIGCSHVMFYYVGPLKKELSELRKEISENEKEILRQGDEIQLLESQLAKAKELLNRAKDELFRGQFNELHNEIESFLKSNASQSKQL